MKDHIKSLCDELENDIKSAYEESITIPEAEKLAAKFLRAQIVISNEIRVLDLDSRMKKSGLKAIRAAIYMEAATKDVKKPSDVMLENLVTMNELVQGEQDSFDNAEVDKDEMERFYNISREGHLFFRAVAKGRFE